MPWVDRYTWQQAVCGEQGPKSSTARLVLLTVSLHMDAQGMNAWPSQATLARRACVSRRSVTTHLDQAQRDGWITRTTAGRNGQGWRLTGYEASVPDDVYRSLPERPWESDPEWKRGERPAPRNAYGGEAAAPPQSERGATDTADVAQLTTERGATGAEGGAPGAHESSLLNLPSESSLGVEGALASTARKGGEGDAQPSGADSRRELRAISERLKAEKPERANKRGRRVGDACG